MPKFNITFSRPTYESVVVQIEADDEDDADEKATEILDETLDVLKWEPHGWNREDSIDIDDIEEVEEEPTT